MQLNVWRILTAYRTQLMGIAILWVFSYHMTVDWSKYFGYGVDWLFNRIGYGGVDIFMFLSGFGIAFSLKKNPRIGQFVGRRFVRIFPLFFFIGLISLFYRGGEFTPRLRMIYTY